MRSLGKVELDRSGLLTGASALAMHLLMRRFEGDEARRAEVLQFERAFLRLVQGRRRRVKFQVKSLNIY